MKQAAPPSIFRDLIDDHCGALPTNSPTALSIDVLEPQCFQKAMSNLFRGGPHPIPRTLDAQTPGSLVGGVGSSIASQPDHRD